MLIQYRLNYWVLHYAFIFLTGAICAVHYQSFLSHIKRFRYLISLFAALTLCGMLSAYYWLLFAKNYTLEATVDTVHQLSPIGVLYTLGATLFLFMIFSCYKFTSRLANPLALLGRRSYTVYLVHPLVMYQLNEYFIYQNILMTTGHIVIFWSLTLICSLLFSQALQFTSKGLPLLEHLLTGKPTTNSK